MVKKENKDLSKRSKSNKKSKNNSEDNKITDVAPVRTKPKNKRQTKKKQQVEESDDEYELPKPSFEYEDENVEQALSASFMVHFEEKHHQRSKTVGDSVNLADKPTKKQVAAEVRKTSKSQEKISAVEVEEKQAVKRKQNKENDDVDTKRRKAKENPKSTGSRPKRKQNEIVEVTGNSKVASKAKQQKKLGNIKVEAGTININVTAEPKQQRGVKKQKVNTVETEKSQTKKLESDDSKPQTEGQILLSVGNLPGGCNREALNFFFNESDLYPEISLKKKSVTTENERGEKRRRNVIKGSATLICKSQAEAEAILKLDGVMMTSVTGEESEITISLKQSSDPIESATKLYVGGLHPKIPEEELQEALEDEGISLTKVKRERFKGTKRPKGYGFIWLPTPKDVTKALAAKITLEGKQLVITHCKQ